ncbi:MAG: hypothetical protein ABI963_10190, partial [Rhizomicrobium sp.]
TEHRLGDATSIKKRPVFRPGTEHRLGDATSIKKRPVFRPGVECAVTRVDARRGLPAPAENRVWLASGGAELAGPHCLPGSTYAQKQHFSSFFVLQIF